MASDKSEYQWKFEYACVAIVFLLIGLILTRMEVNKAEDRAEQLEREIESVQSEYYDLGFSDGSDKGYIKGYDDGMADYENDGYSEGYEKGYLYGYAFGIKDAGNGALKEMDPFTKNFLLELADEKYRGKPF